MRFRLFENSSSSKITKEDLDKEDAYYRLSIEDYWGDNLGGLFNAIWKIIYHPDTEENEDIDRLEDLIDILQDKHQVPSEWFEKTKFAFTKDFYTENFAIILEISQILEDWGYTLKIDKITPNNIIYKDKDQIAYKENSTNIKESINNEELSNEYDSEGNQLTRAQAKFFKNSKVRDSKGRLLVVYHGSNMEFNIFAKDKIKTGTFGNGFYFTTQKYSGDSYGKYNKKYYLNIENYIKLPAEYEDITEFVSDKYFNDRYNVRLIDNQTATNIIREDGFDGISTPMYNNWGEFEYYVVFESNQIKSITNKNPTNSDNINEEIQKPTQLENKLINKLKSQGYQYYYKPVGWYDENDKQITNFTSDENSEWEPKEDYFYRENNSHIFTGDNVELIWDIDELEKTFTIIDIWSYKGAQKGEATQMLRECLDEIPEGWTIIIKDNLNRSYWEHISSKFPKYEWTNESLEK